MNITVQKSFSIILIVLTTFNLAVNFYSEGGSSKQIGPKAPFLKSARMIL